MKTVLTWISQGDSANYARTPSRTISAPSFSTLLRQTFASSFGLRPIPSNFLVPASFLARFQVWRNIFHGSSCSSSEERPPKDSDPELLKKARENPRSMTDEEWKQVLSPRQFDVARNHGTERAFTGELCDNKEKGEYLCVCCSAQLFDSSTKFDSGSGWPSFYDTTKVSNATGGADNIARKTDPSLGMARTEVLCKRCGAHLGHVFEDGPKPTGMRYCINSAALEFKKD